MSELPPTPPSAPPADASPPPPLPPPLLPLLSPPAPRRLIAACVAGLLLLFVGLALYQAARKSETYDEPMYILSGYSYLVTGDLSFNREHPPLAKYLIGLPLLGLHLWLPDDYQVRPGIEYSFYARQPEVPAPELLFRARLPGIALGVVLLLYVWRWASLAFGWRAGLAALLLCALNPSVLAHSTIAANDFALAVFSVATLYHLWRWLATGARASLLLCALMLGCALGSKLTALLLLPVMGTIVLVCAIRKRRPSIIGWALLGGLAAAGVLWLLYLGEARSLEQARVHPRFTVKGGGGQVFHSERLERTLESVFGRTTPIPLLGFLKGIDYQLDQAREGHSNYWRGRASDEGAPEFFVVSWLIKNPEALSLLLLLGLLSLSRTARGWGHEAALYAFPLVLFIVFSRSNSQLGFKYVLPAVPLLCIAASRALATRPGRPGAPDDRPLAPTRELLQGALLVPLVSLSLFAWCGDVGPRRWSHYVPLVVPLLYGVLAWTRPPVASEPLGGTRVRRWHDLRLPLALLLAWAAAAVLARQPDNLMYFNEWVGGPENGWRWSVIGDDWGQDTAELGRWMQREGVEHLVYDYYGEGDPAAWGVRSVPAWGDPHETAPDERWMAVHVTSLMRSAEKYWYLRGQEPVVRLGHTIFVYRL
ncbi:MAG TPA: glycosyltransferase family 39 protein [Planctomycetota bacterium]|nr:glycosyltransferase family 39 protein [Planctomycetota bacterium]